MKITPYLLWLNGFKPYEGRTECWRRVEINPFTTNTIEMIVEPACFNCVWKVYYRAPEVKCELYIKTFQDLMKFSEVMSNNRHGFTEVHPIVLTIPNFYTENDWERGDLDQGLFDEKIYQYV